jgi:hypothetical protein
MKTHPIILAVAILIISGGLASAQQQQYDSLGSPTPRPNQNASPNMAPSVSSPSTTGQSGSMERPSTPPKANANSPSTAGQAPNLSSGNAGTEKTNGVTPGGLTPD